MTALLEKPTETATVIAEATAPTLTVNDRCDAGGSYGSGSPHCDAQARSYILYKSGSSLMLCKHHTVEKLAGLEESGATIFKQYDGLDARLDASA